MDSNYNIMECNNVMGYGKSGGWLKCKVRRSSLTEYLCWFLIRSRFQIPLSPLFQCMVWFPPILIRGLVWERILFSEESQFKRLKWRRPYRWALKSMWASEILLQSAKCEQNLVQWRKQPPLSLWMEVRDDIGSKRMRIRCYLRKSCY